MLTFSATDWFSSLKGKAENNAQQKIKYHPSFPSLPSIYRFSFAKRLWILLGMILSQHLSEAMPTGRRCREFHFECESFKIEHFRRLYSTLVQKTFGSVRYMFQLVVFSVFIVLLICLYFSVLSRSSFLCCFVFGLLHCKLNKVSSKNVFVMETKLTQLNIS